MTRNQQKTLDTLIASHRIVRIEHTEQAIIRCTARFDLPNGIKAGDVFYLVRSDSYAGYYYFVRWNAVAWDCSCPSVKPCKHQTSVNSAVIARCEKAKAPKPLAAFELPSDKGFDMKREQEKINAFLARAEQAKIVKSWETAPLNGQRGFALMR